MARKKNTKIEADEDGVLFSMPNEAVDDAFDGDEDFLDSGDYPSGVNMTCHADAFNLPVDAPQLSRIMSAERMGRVMIREKQVFPCPKEGCVQVYIEYVDVEV